MKTTVEITDDLLREARAQASLEGTSVRALMEEGLRKVLDQRKTDTSQFKMRKVSVSGSGLNPEFATWDAVRDLIYENPGF
jgi:hypothetical protein